MRNLMLRVAIAMTIVAVVVSCQDDGTNLGEGLLKVDLNVISINTSSAGRTQAVNTDDFKVTIFNADDTEYVVYDPFSSAPSEVSLPTGEYFIEASSDNLQNAAFDEPFYFGRSDNFTIDKEEETIVIVDIDLANTQVSIVWSTSTQTDFDDYNAIVTNVNTSDNLTFTAAETRSGYFLSGEDLSIEATLTYTKLDLSVIEKKYYATISNPLPKTHYQINVDAALIDGQVTIQLNVDETVDVIVIDADETPPTVQERLDGGETPIDIYNSGIPLDSLYGRFYAGGLIFYLNTSNGTGFISSENDQGSSQWGCDVDGTAAPIGIGTGQQNTLNIIADCSSNTIAPAVCNNLSQNGFNDWFLPSKNELNEMYTNLHLNGFGAFSTSIRYWSSSQQTFSFGTAYGHGWYQNFATGEQAYAPKNNTYRFRAVRTF